MTPEERFDHLESAIEKQNAGIRDLVVVSRTVLNSIQTTNEAIDKLREAQAETDEKLNILVATVDRIIRKRNGKTDAGDR